MNRSLRLLAATAAIGALALGACSSDDSSDESTSTSEASSSGATGLTSEQVVQLQEDLAKVGCYEGEADGEEGPETLAAIKAFQQAEGLEVDDIVGTETQSALESAAADGKTVCAASTPTTAASSGTATTPTTASSGSSGTAAPASTEPPCTEAATLAVMKAHDSTVVSVSSPDCAKGADGTWWAVVSPSTSEIDYTAVLKGESGTWVYAGGNDICSELPSSLQSACNTN